MTKRDRVLKAFDFEPVDRVPLMDCIQHGPLAAKVAGRESKHDFWTREEAGKIACKYLDMAQGLSSSYPQKADEIEHAKIIKDGKETWYLSETVDGLKRKRNYWMGAVVERPFADLKSATSFVKKKIAETEKELSDRNWQVERRRYHAEVAETKELMGDTELLLMTPGGGLGVDVLYAMIGWEFFSQLIFDQPDLVRMFIDMQAEGAYQWVRNVIENADEQPVALIYCDIASTTGLMLSPEWIQENMYGNIERLASFYKSRGIRVLYHSEGNITRVIDDLISLGIEGINPLEKTVTGMSVPEVRKRWPRLVLWGGVDNKDLLVHGTVDEVRREVEFLVDTYGRDGGLLLGSSGQIHPGCKLDNVIAMYDTALSL